MTSTLVWVLLPLGAGVGLLFYRSKGLLPLVAGSLLAIFLVWAAWQIPIDDVLQLGPISIEILPSFVIAGRNFTLSAIHAPLLVMVYLMELLWILGSYLAKPGRLFIPLSLITTSLFVAALAVEPFIYGALLLAMASLLVIPALVPPGSNPGKSVQRFFKFQVLAVPLILFAGWVLSGVEANPGNQDLILRAGLLLGLGFTLLLALFPLHSWVPMLSAESHPYTFMYLFGTLTSFSMVFALGFFDRYAWLRETSFVSPILLALGGLTAVLSGLWGAREANPRRILAYAGLFSIGSSIQAIGISTEVGVEVFFALLIPQLFTLWVWATALSALSKQTTSDGEGFREALATKPISAIAMLLSILSLAGLPVLSLFSSRVALLDAVASASPWTAVLSLLGSAALLKAGLSLLLHTLPVRENGGPRWLEEGEAPAPRLMGELAELPAWIFGGVSLLGTLIFGLLPQIILAGVPALAAIFTQLAP